MPISQANHSVVKFSLKAAIVFIAFTSVLLAISIAVIESQPVASQPVLVTSLIIGGCVAAFVILLFCVWRRIIERTSGKLLMKPATLSWARWMLFGILGSFFLLMLMLPIYMLLPTFVDLFGVEQNKPGSIPFLGVSAGVFIVPIVGLVHVFIMFWWGLSLVSLEIRQNGIVLGGLRFIPWTSKIEFEWREGKNAVLIIKSGRRNSVGIFASELKAEVGEQLRAMGQVVKD